MVETTINAQTKHYLREEQLARMLLSMEFDEKYMVQVFNFFTDVPLQDVERFMAKYGISCSALRAYYEKYVKDYYRNPGLEEMLSVA
ncbi:MAG TPA: hypothetical protein DCE07_08710 [Peptococcaceae bacterium]|nr:hypothetical protein [Peptococcaceae bacterium]